jgi:O-antigen/teichoic acid export membrane protein
LQWFGPASSAQITVALRLCTTAAGILAVLTQPLWPAFVDAASVGDRQWALRTLSWGTAAVAASAVGGGTLVICFGQEILRWWLHADMDIRPIMLWSIAGWIVALSVPRVSTLLMSALSAFRFQLIVAALAAMAALMLKFTLSRQYGAAGILAATPISWVLIAWPAYIFRLSKGIVPPAWVSAETMPITGRRHPASGKVLL